MTRPFDQTKMLETHVMPFQFNFTRGTSRFVKYHDSELFKGFINKAIRDVKKQDL